MKSLSRFSTFYLMILAACFFAACEQATSNDSTDMTATTTTDAPVNIEKPLVPDWHKNANIYEVNLRQYTSEGTYRAFARHLPRLKEMGVDILWFMPIQPISVKNRKGPMGSYYAVADYKESNPEFGTLEDFKWLMSEIHKQGMYGIIDWVPNHTGWDNPWIESNPEWFTRDSAGNVIDPIDPATGESWGWTDVADLNYDNQEMRAAMTDAMAFWVKECDIDGFRMDVAHNVPGDFWADATDSLYAIEPLFMLAEAEVPAIVNNGAFVVDYAWEFHHLLNDIAKSQGAVKSTGQKLVKGNLVDSAGKEVEKKNANDIMEMIEKKREQYNKGYQMHFTSNHDENAWSGPALERFGESFETFSVLTATLEGTPLIYSGQEDGLNRKLEFFEKDTIVWGDFKYAEFYRTLFDLKHKNQALWNGEAGGELVRIPTGKDEAVFAFYREKNGDKVVVVLNFSKENQEIKLEGDNYVGQYNNVFAKGGTALTQDMAMNLKPWDYVVLSNQ